MLKLLLMGGTNFRNVTHLRAAGVFCDPEFAHDAADCAGRWARVKSSFVLVADVRMVRQMVRAG